MVDKIKVITYGNKIQSDEPRKREFYVEALCDGEPVELEETIRVLKNATWMLKDWIVETPIDTPWYRVQQCKYCVEAVKRRFERKRITYLDWWWSYCKRHATCEFLSEIGMVDNKKRIFDIDLEKEEIVANVNTNRHSAEYRITRDEIVATLDGTKFRYRAHVSSWPYEPSYNVIVRHIIRLLSELKDVLERPEKYWMSLYYNGELIYLQK